MYIPTLCIDSGCAQHMDSGWRENRWKRHGIGPRMVQSMAYLRSLERGLSMYKAIRYGQDVHATRRMYQKMYIGLGYLNSSSSMEIQFAIFSANENICL